MIGESSGVATLLNNERIFREAQVGDARQSAPEREQPAEEAVSDVTRFSAEAIALSREVVAAGEGSELDSNQTTEQPPEPAADEQQALPFRAIA